MIMLRSIMQGIQCLIAGDGQWVWMIGRGGWQLMLIDGPSCLLISWWLAGASGATVINICFTSFIMLNQQEQSDILERTSSGRWWFWDGVCRVLCHHWWPFFPCWMFLFGYGPKLEHFKWPTYFIPTISNIQLSISAKGLWLPFSLQQPHLCAEVIWSWGLYCMFFLLFREFLAAEWRWVDPTNRNLCSPRRTMQVRI